MDVRINAYQEIMYICMRVQPSNVERYFLNAYFIHMGQLCLYGRMHVTVRRSVINYGCVIPNERI